VQAHVYDALRTGALLVTANKRLARLLRQEFDDDAAAHSRAWPSPAIVAWDGWMNALWQELLFSSNRAQPVRIATQRERLVWESTITQSASATRLLQPGAAADAVQRAWALCREWRIPLDEVEAVGQEDALAFVGWARDFEQQCTRHGWVAEAGIPDRIREWLGEATLPSPSLPLQVFLAGFDELTPQREEFAAACRAAGAAVDLLPPVDLDGAGHRVRVAYPDAEQELTAAARWARALMETGAPGRIGVVLPDVDKRRSAVDRVFRSVLAPASLLPGEPLPAGLLNISAGMPLLDYEAIAAAFALLELDPREDEWERIGAVVRSGYVAGAETERSARALLDARLRREGEVRIRLAHVLDCCGREGCAGLAAALRQWERVRQAAPRRQTPGEWSRTFSALLTAAGWPGERRLGSAEYQTVEAWKTALAEFAGMDAVSGPVESRAALSLLRRITSNTLFQPETDTAVVEVLGTLQAAGIGYDHLWIAGLDDETWPGPPKPNPFLPAQLQRRRGLPHASPERELRFAELVTGRLLASAPDVVVSHAERDGDRELLPSPLILRVPKGGPGEIPASPVAAYGEAIRESGPVEVMVDPGAPALVGGAPRGGSRIFELQAACPFHAFAELRLLAERLETPQPGLDPRVRGNLVHVMLEVVWKQLRTHEALCALSDDELAAAAGDAARQALAEVCPGIEERFAQLELERLRRLGVAWLQMEKVRQPFTVLDPEREREVTVGGIECRVRIDRIDRLASGGDMIIDYKTGPANIRDWDTQRPRAPQLPLYAITHPGTVAGVMFGKVRIGEVGFTGYAERDADPKLDNQSTEIAPLLESWRETLERLGAEHRGGRAEIDPKDTETCRYCALATLCRVNEDCVPEAEDD
jgi:ATP-dependent helicase/nuclease subunit B